MRKVKQHLAILAVIIVTIVELSYTQPQIPKESIPSDIPSEVRKQIEELYSPDFLKRVSAARELANMSIRAATAVPFLIQSLGDGKVFWV